MEQAGGDRVKKRVTRQRCPDCRAGRGQWDVLAGNLRGPLWCEGQMQGPGRRRSEPTVNVMGVSWARKVGRHAGVHFSLGHLSVLKTGRWGQAGCERQAGGRGRGHEEVEQGGGWQAESPWGLRPQMGAGVVWGWGDSSRKPWKVVF